jgi:hypothetical protein
LTRNFLEFLWSQSELCKHQGVVFATSSGRKAPPEDNHQTLRYLIKNGSPGTTVEFGVKFSIFYIPGSAYET